MYMYVPANRIKEILSMSLSNRRNIGFLTGSKRKRHCSALLNSEEIGERTALAVAFFLDSTSRISVRFPNFPKLNASASEEYPNKPAIDAAAPMNARRSIESSKIAFLTFSSIQLSSWWYMEFFCLPNSRDR